MAATRSRCIKCRAKFDGKGQYCLSCISSLSTMVVASKRSRPAARSAAPKGEGGPVCPHCLAPLTWDNLRSEETEVSIYVREKMYFCPECRAILGFSSWHTEG